MNTAPIIERVRDLAPLFKEVGGAADYDAAVKALKAAPACFMIEQASQPLANASIVGARQQVRTQIGVILAVNMLRDSAGAADRDDLEEAREAVRAALLGWIPAAGFTAMTYAGGFLMDFEPGRLWWQDSFSTTHIIRGG